MAEYVYSEEKVVNPGDVVVMSKEYALKKMTIKEFARYLKTKDVETQIVYLRYKYSWEDTWTYSNEILEVDMGVDGFYVWKTDWNEGQEDVEILGCIAVSDVEVPLF